MKSSFKFFPEKILTLLTIFSILLCSSSCAQTAKKIQESDSEDYLNKEAFKLTPRHVEILRKLTVVWDYSESGAPIVDIYSFPFDYQQIGKLLGLQISESDFENGNQNVKQFSAAMGSIFEILIQHGKLKSGTYRYKNPLYQQKDVPTPPGAEKILTVDSITFKVTEDHIKLLHRANAGWLNYWSLPGINSKRPFGDMTCFYLDMADILHILPVKKEGEYCEDRFTKQQIKMFDKLHQEMFYVLQVFLLYATIEPGNYFRENSYTEWNKIP